MATAKVRTWGKDVGQEEKVRIPRRGEGNGDPYKDTWLSYKNCGAIPGSAVIQLGFMKRRVWEGIGGKEPGEEALQCRGQTRVSGVRAHELSSWLCPWASQMPLWLSQQLHLTHGAVQGLLRGLKRSSSKRLNTVPDTQKALNGKQVIWTETCEKSRFWISLRSTKSVTPWELHLG